ncbi:MAG: EAL domain-containing protein [Desulfovibrionaceae bacterium]
MKNKFPYSIILVLLFLSVPILNSIPALRGNDSASQVTALYDILLPPYFYEDKNNKLVGIIPSLIENALAEIRILSFKKVPTNTVEKLLLKDPGTFYIGIEPLFSAKTKEIPATLVKGDPLLTIEYTIFHDTLLTLQNFTSLALFSTIPIGYTEECGLPLEILVSYYPQFILQIYPSINDMLEAMASQKIQACILNKDILATFTNSPHIIEYKTPLFTMNINPYFSKEHTELIHTVNNAIRNVNTVEKNTEDTIPYTPHYIVLIGISLGFILLIIQYLWRKKEYFLVKTTGLSNNALHNYFLLQITQNGTVQTVSQEIEIILGYNAKESIGKNISAFAKNDTQLATIFQNIQDTKKASRVTLYTLQNTQCSFDVYPIYVVDSILPTFVLVQVYKNDNFLTHILDIMPLSIARINIKGQYIYANTTFINEFSQKRTLLGSTIFSDFDITTVNTILEYAKNNSVTKSHILSLFSKKHSQEKLYSISVYSGTMHNEAILDIFLFDISSLHTINKELEPLSQNISSIINFLPDPAFILDTHGSIIAWNTALEKLTKTSADDMIGKADGAYSLPFYGVKRAMACDYFFSNSHPGNTNEKEKDSIALEAFCPYLDNNKGKYLFSYAARIYTTENTVFGIIQSMQDITQRKEEFFELEKSKRRYSMILSASDEGMWEWSSKDNSLYLSQKSNEILSIPEKEQNSYTIAKYILAKVHLEDIANLQNHISLLRNNKLDKCDCIFRIKTNNSETWKWIHARAAVDYSSENTINAIVGSLSDITERKETENITRIIFLISSAVNITREPKELFRAIHTILKRYVGYSNLLVSLWNSENNNIEYPYLEDDQDDTEQNPLLYEDQEIPVYINNVLQSGKQILFIEESSHNAKTWLSTPLRVRNTIVGTITTYRTLSESNGTYSKRDKELMIAIGEQVAIAIERYNNEKQLTTMALHDPLTGLPNRVLMNDRIEHAIRRVQRNAEYRFAVFMLDLDRFKLINDTHGHNTGDLLLIEVSKRMLALLRAQDTVARLGGDEFAIILENLHSTHEALAVAKRILKAIEQPIFIDGKELRTATTIGIVLDASTYDSAQSLMRDADIAMYDAKSNGKGRFRVFDQAMHQQMLDYVSLENDLANAVTNNQLYLDFQPIISTADKTLLGFEALIRWNHPERGIVPPNKFIPIAEENGHIVTIGNWVLEEACRIMHSWVVKEPQSSQFTISVNLSAKQAVQSTLTNTIGEILRKTKLAPEQLKLEITETTIMSDPLNAMKSFNSLRSMGVHIAIDDFGTGYSSMAYLQKFPVDTIKIDRTFIMNLSSEANDGSIEIVRAIASLAHGLGMNIVAEGVETEEQLATIIDCGCEAVQGYLFSRPLGEQEALEYIQLYSSS